MEGKKEKECVGGREEKREIGQQEQEVGGEFQLRRQKERERKREVVSRPSPPQPSDSVMRRAWLLVATHRATVTRGALLLPACLPPTPHPITASTFPPTTLLLTGSTYYLTHTYTSHSVSLHTHRQTAD